MSPTNSLQKQLDHQKFLNVIEHIRKEAAGPKLLNSGELIRMNRHLSGKVDDTYDPWRSDEVKVQFKGREAHFSLMSNPLSRARDLISHGVQLSGSGQPIEAAFFIYSQFVLTHLFKEANRRTAVAAAFWFLIAANQECDAEELLKLPIGDLRQESEKAALRAAMMALLRS